MAIRRRKKVKRKKLPSIRSLWSKAWSLQSKYIRSHAADFQGYAKCYTCYRVYPWQQLQLGHFIHGSYDFDAYANLRPQCQFCNKYGHGKPLEYYIHLVEEIGLTAADHARKRAHWNGYSRADLLETIKKYT